MNEWNVVLVIIALGGFIITLLKTVTSLTTQIATLNTNIKNITDGLNKLTTDNTKTHRELHETVNDHEVRITLIERWKGHNEK